MYITISIYTAKCTCPFLRPTSSPSLPGGPPMTLIYLMRDSITHSFSFTPWNVKHCNLLSWNRGKIYTYQQIQNTFAFIAHRILLTSLNAKSNEDWHFWWTSEVAGKLKCTLSNICYRFRFTYKIHLNNCL